jgi:hypothetical protein
MLRFVSLAAAVIAAAALAGGSTAGKAAFPEVIQLPAGFQPEGIEVGRGTTFYVGSRVTGAIYRGNLRTGTGAILVPGGAGRLATGIEFSRNRLFVAGAGTGDGYVYDARTGALVRTYDFASTDTFINDVVVTRSAAYFTDSRKALLYKVPIGTGGALGAFQTVGLTGAMLALPGFNLNGIDATRNGKTLIAVQSNTGMLFRIDVAVISLAANLASGSVVTRLSDPDFSVPTTIDDLGRRLYAVNARFNVPNPGTAEYQVVQLAKPRLR